MGYRGKLAEQEEARRLRALGYTYNEIVAELGVSKLSVSLWCRDVDVDEAVWRARAGENHRRGNLYKRPSSLKVRKQAQIEQLRADGRERIGVLSDREFLLVGVALYASEGSKTGNAVGFPNSDPRMILMFLSWLRHFFAIDESRLRIRLYLHDGLDLEAATAFWSELTGIPLTQFRKPYRAKADPSIRKSKHPMGCPRVDYSCTTTLRTILGLCDALLTCQFPFRGGEIGITADC